MNPVQKWIITLPLYHANTYLSTAYLMNEWNETYKNHMLYIDNVYIGIVISSLKMPRKSSIIQLEQTVNPYIVTILNVQIKIHREGISRFSVDLFSVNCASRVRNPIVNFALPS